MTASRHILEENPQGTKANAGGQAPQVVKPFIFNQMKIRSMQRRLYGFCTKNEAKIPRNSFTEKTLRLRLQWNDDFTQDPPSLSPNDRGRWPQVRTSPQGEGGAPCETAVSPFIRSAAKIQDDREEPGRMSGARCFVVFAMIPV
jgi:hypothetical protein